MSEFCTMCCETDFSEEVGRNKHISIPAAVFLTTAITSYRKNEHELARVTQRQFSKDSINDQSNHQAKT